MLLCASAPLRLIGQTAVLFPLAQMTGTTNDTTITVKPVNNPVDFNSQVYWLPTAGIQLKTVNGSAATNLIPNDYTVTISGVPGSWRISVNDTNVTLNAALIGNLTTYTFNAAPPFVQQLIAGPNITLAPTNGKGVVTISSTGGGGGGSATNVWFVDGTGTHWAVVNNSNQVNVTGFQPASLGLTNWSQLPTNVFDTRYDLAGTAQAIANTTSNYLSISNAYILSLSNTVYQNQFAQKVSTNAGTSYGQTLFNPTNTIIGVNVLEAGAKGGTNDDTAILNAILARGGNIFFPPTNYTAGALWLTNNTRITGYGARIDLLTNLTSTTLLNMPTNVNNWLVEGLSLNGGNTNDCYGAVRATNTMRFGAAPGVSTRGTFFRDYFYGFDTGVKPVPMTDGITVQQLPHVQFMDCEWATNGIGLALESKSTSVCAEYFEIVKQNCHDNSYGIWIAAGNDAVRDCNINHNFINVCVDGSNGFNPGHSSISHNTMNHPGSRYMVCTNLTVGEMISDNIFRGTSAELALSGCKGVVVMLNNWESGCRVGNYGISGGVNFVVYNTTAGDFGINANGLRVFDWALNVDGPTTNIDNWGTFSFNHLGFDDPYLWNPFATNTAGVNNGVSFTNLIHSSTVSAVSGVSVATTTNADGSANYGLTVTASGTGNVSGTGSSTAGNFAALSNTSATGITDSLFSATSFDVANAAHDATNALYATLNAAKADKTTTITINGTGNQLNSSAGAQDLSANRVWALSLSTTMIAPGTFAAVTSVNSPKYFLGPWVFGTNATDGTFLLSNGPNAQFILSIGTNGVLTGNGTGFTNATGNRFAATNELLDASTATANGYAYFGGSTNLFTTNNGIGWTNLQHPESVLGPASNATNYTLNVAATRKQTIITANTNANFTFSNIATNKELDIYVDALTSSVPCNVTFPAHVVLNHSAALTVTNGQAYYFHIDFYDGTDPTNAIVTGGDYYTRQ